MRRRVQFAVAMLLALLATSVGIPALSRARQAAKSKECSLNLGTVGFALLDFHSWADRFPRGTLPNPALPPERRLSWLIQLYAPSLGAVRNSPLDPAKAWDSNENSLPTPDRNPSSSMDNLHCPAKPSRKGSPLPSPTDYLGIAGVGKDAASLPLSDPRSGVFGYDRTVSIADLKDGTSTTAAVAEATDGGPWMAGGRATVRGLESGRMPYLGRGGQFASLHHQGDVLSWSSPVVTNVLFADGSVRGMTAKVSPGVFEALATIAGGEEIGPLDQ